MGFHREFYHNMWIGTGCPYWFSRRPPFSVQVFSGAASQRTPCTNARAEETVRWTCTCAGNARSAGWESARRWACWQSVSVDMQKRALAASGCEKLEQQWDKSKVLALLSVTCTIFWIRLRNRASLTPHNTKGSAFVALPRSEAVKWKSHCKKSQTGLVWVDF